jgi:hypothetical protein
VLDRIDELLNELDITIERVRRGELDAKQLRERIDELERLKKRVLELFPTIYGLKFVVVFEKLELIDRLIAAAQDEAPGIQAGSPSRSVLPILRRTKRAKDQLEKALRAQLLVLKLQSCITHFRLGFPGRSPLGADFRAQLQTVITTEPGTKVDFKATASEPDAFVGGADTSTGR